VLDEFRILIETASRESQIDLHWDVAASLPLVWADRPGLTQVFLNLAKNSQRAMTSTDTRQLRISASEERGHVVIRFEDTGTGIASPERLFQPFFRGAESTGLGLYVSRAIMRSFGGDLCYEARAVGCCFAMVLPLRAAPEDASYG
jgi:two-component system sensor kinase FixL